MVDGLNCQIKPNLQGVNIPSRQVRSRRRIGHVGSRGVYQVDLVGGLTVVAAARADGDMEILGMASHPLLARNIAGRHASHIDYDDIAKSETYVDRDFGDLLPRYLEMTAEARAAQGL